MGAAESCATQVDLSAATEMRRACGKDLSHAPHLSGVVLVFRAEDDPSGDCVKTTRPAGM